MLKFIKVKQITKMEPFINIKLGFVENLFNVNKVSEMNNKQLLLIVIFVLIQNISEVHLTTHKKRTFHDLGTSKNPEYCLV